MIDSKDLLFAEVVTDFEEGFKPGYMTRFTFVLLMVTKCPKVDRGGDR